MKDTHINYSSLFSSLTSSFKSSFTASASSCFSGSIFASSNFSRASSFLVGSCSCFSPHFGQNNAPFSISAEHLLQSFFWFNFKISILASSISLDNSSSFLHSSSKSAFISIFSSLTCFSYTFYF